MRREEKLSGWWDNQKVQLETGQQTTTPKKRPREKRIGSTPRWRGFINRCRRMQKPIKIRSKGENDESKKGEGEEDVTT